MSCVQNMHESHVVANRVCLCVWHTYHVQLSCGTGATALLGGDAAEHSGPLEGITLHLALGEQIPELVWLLVLAQDFRCEGKPGPPLLSS